MNNVITLENSKGYATEENLIKGIKRVGLDYYTEGFAIPMRYVVARKPDGKWTAIFLVSQFFDSNNTGGYVGVASQYGFMSL